MLTLAILLMGPGSLIYPPPDPSLNFDHALHLGQGLDCNRCHADVQNSIRVSDSNLPPEKTCLDCHDVWATDEPAQTCKTCHVGYTPTLPAGVKDTHSAQPWPQRPAPVEQRLIFSHRLHNDRGVGCKDCHRAIAGNNNAMSLPTMTECQDCHRSRGVTNRCGSCHVERPDGRLKVRFGQQRLKPNTRVRAGLAHVGDFASSHGAAAKAEPARCQTCHSEPECRRCHMGQAPPLALHPADYVHHHAVDARRDPVSCEKCHRQQTFCVSCHALGGLSPRDGPFGFGAGRSGARFHPPGFEGGFGQGVGPNHHGFAARRNMGACVSCHQEQDCVRCHSAGAPDSLRANPHPVGFRCGTLLRSNPRSCMKCHQDQGALEAACRR